MTETDASSVKDHRATSAGAADVLCCAQVNHQHPFRMKTLRDQIGDTPLALLKLFVTPRSLFEDIVAEAAKHFPTPKSSPAPRRAKSGPSATART